MNSSSFHVQLLVIAVLLVNSTCTLSQTRREEGPYKVDPASIRKEGVPKGMVLKRTFKTSQIFPGTEREYAIYVPAQYDPATPACLMVFQDGMRFASEQGESKVPVVFDNLIDSREMPVTIGVFVDPGVVPAQDDSAQPRYNRSFEYDSVDDRFAQFLVSELLPEVEQDYSLSSNPNDRGICGSSSGGIAAFNVAWQKPDQFRRVYSMVGTFVGLRGANQLEVLVRETEPKPIRVFLQDGSNDNNIYCGDWWVANQGMLSALEFSGYEVAHLWGEGYHGQKHGGAIFPQAMRFLWKDWPTEVATHFDRCRSRASEMLVPGEDWELVSDGHGFADGPVVDLEGNLFFSDVTNGQVVRVDVGGNQSVIWDINQWISNKRLAHPLEKPYVDGLAIGPDSALYGCLPALRSVVKFNNDGTSEFEALTENVKSNDVVVAHDGTIYFTEPEKKRVWMQKPGSQAKVAGEGFSGVHGITLSPDQSLVYVGDFDGRYVWSGVRAADGTLSHIQPYFHMHSPPAAIDLRTHNDGMCVDKDGWVLVATKMGIQICDQPGRVNLIVPPPSGSRHPSNVTFGGLDRQTLYITCGSQVFKRKVKLKGADPWSAPVKPGKPRL